MAMRGRNETWYRLKKSVVLFPLSARRDRAARPFQSAAALRPFYADMLARAGPARRLWFHAGRLIFVVWAGWRVRRLAALWRLPAAEGRQTLSLARRRFIDPREIVLDAIAGDAEADTHIRRFEETAINRVTNPAHWRPGCPMRDKIAFARRCAEHGLPHPALRAWRQGGRVVVDSLPPDGRLFARPAAGTAGAGARIVDLPPGLPASQAAAFLSREPGRGTDWIAQDVARNHPDIAPYALSALSTLRVVTIRNQTGAAEAAGVVMKIAADPDAVVDNGGRHGLNAGVDLSSGRLRPGARWYEPHFHDANPASGVIFAGRRVPMLDAALALARRAHDDAFPEYACVGWDIAVTPRGPLLIEGNPKGSTDFVRRPGAAAMPLARFADLIALNIARARARPGPVDNRPPPRHVRRQAS